MFQPTLSSNGMAFGHQLYIAGLKQTNGKRVQYVFETGEDNFSIILSLACSDLKHTKDPEVVIIGHQNTELALCM